LLVGKSLGGWHMLTRVVNILPRLRYSKIGLVTVDPCAPKLWDWTPDRFSEVLPLHSGRVDIAVNLVSTVGSFRGARVGGPAVNVLVKHATHHNITRHPGTARRIKAVARRLEGR
jgi:hypothetical protein